MNNTTILQNAPIRKHNASRKYYTGSTWNTYKHGDVVVVGQVDLAYKNTIYCYFRVKFFDGTEINTASASIRKKKIKNPNHRGVCGEGYIGIGKYSSQNSPREYQRWGCMLERCYGSGGQNYAHVSVCERWKCFQSFVEDLPSLPGYTAWLRNPRLYDLDKDIRSSAECVVYSKDTCAFVTHKENTSRNNRRVTLTGMVYVGTRIVDGYVEEFTNQSAFAETYNISQANISSWCTGARTFSHLNGWTFKIKED